MADPRQLDALLRETHWLAGLARQLVSRREDADDLVQETMRKAVEHPPAAGRSVRGWLHAIMVHRWTDVGRSERARAAREHAVAAAHDAPATVDVVAKAELHRNLVDDVLALDEPYRTCLLLRFFESLPPREIARRTSSPIATVNSRLQRALTKMRQRLADRYGSRWSVAVAPLLIRKPFAPTLLGVSLVNGTARVVVGVAVLVVAVLAWNWSMEPEPVGERAAGAVEPSTSADVVGDVEPAAEPQQRVAVVDSGSSSEATRVASPELRGRVIDVQGVGIGGVALAFGQGANRSVGVPLFSDAGGRFRFAPLVDHTTIVSTDARWATVLAGSTRLRTEDVSTVIVAPPIQLGGRVVTVDGNPVPRAKVQVHLPAHLGADLGIVLDYSVGVTWEVRCDRHGRFVLRNVPAIADGELSVRLGGYLPRVVELPTSSTESLEVVLERPGEGHAAIEGFVVDARGAYVADARVSAGGTVSRTDERGTFTIDLSSEQTFDRIVAVAKGSLPAMHEPERDAAGRPRWPARVMLQLGEAPLSIVGRVVDRDGEPIEGVKVWVDDPLVVGYGNGSILIAESYLGREDNAFWAFVRTDRSGAFRLDGLLDRTYVLKALEPRTLMVTTRDGVPAGSGDVQLQMVGDLYPELRGRVIARDGTPFPGVTVNVERPALSVRIPGGRGGSMFEWTDGDEAETNQAGEFVLRNVPVEGVFLQANGDTILSAHRSIEPGIDPLAVELVADRRLHLQVELSAPIDRADEFKILNASGRHMLLVLIRGTAHTQNFKMPLLEGRSEVLTLGEGAQTAVFYKDGVEVGRMPVQLVSEQVNTIRF